jgi:adenylate kinase family enzyme
MDFIYVCGGVASGKSTLANRLGDLGYKVVHIDELVYDEFDKWPKNIYIDETMNEDQEKLFSRIIREMEQKIVIDGYISPVLWKKLYNHRPWDLLIYVEHSSLESYYNSILNRAISDIKSGRRTLSSFWRNSLSTEMISEYQKDNNKILLSMVQESAEHKWVTLSDRREQLFAKFRENNWEYIIYRTVNISGHLSQ